MFDDVSVDADELGRPPSSAMVDAPPPRAPEIDDLARLGRGFFEREAVVVARDLLGRIIRTTTATGVTAGRIVEAEAYRASESCCHAHRGRTPRNATMFGPPGGVYVYLIYGLHHCMNLVCGEPGSAVLLRALEPVAGVEIMRARRGPKAPDAKLCAGPGCLCRALGVDRTWDSLDATTSERVSLHLGWPATDVVTTRRIGVVGRPEDVALPWRWHEGPERARRVR